MFVVTCRIGEELRNYVVEAILPPLSSAALCSQQGSRLYKANGNRKIVCHPGTVGRIVRIRSLDKTTGTLTLCEVKVYTGMHKFHIYDNKMGNLLYIFFKYGCYKR